VDHRKNHRGRGHGKAKRSDGDAGEPRRLPKSTTGVPEVGEYVLDHGTTFLVATARLERRDGPGTPPPPCGGTGKVTEPCADETPCGEDAMTPRLRIPVAEVRDEFALELGTERRWIAPASKSQKEGHHCPDAIPSRLVAMAAARLSRCAPAASVRRPAAVSA